MFPPPTYLFGAAAPPPPPPPRVRIVRATEYLDDLTHAGRLRIDDRRLGRAQPFRSSKRGQFYPVRKGRVLLLRVPSVFVVLSVVVVAIAGAVIVTNPQIQQSVPDIIGHFGPLILAVVLLALLFRGSTQSLGYWRRTLLKMAKRGLPLDLGHHAITIGPQGIHHELPERVLDIRWSAITEIVESPGGVMLCDTPRRAYSVPLRTFALPEAAHTFAEAARRYRAAALSTSAV